MQLRQRLQDLELHLNQQPHHPAQAPLQRNNRPARAPAPLLRAHAPCSERTPPAARSCPPLVTSRGC